jgi:serine/threonine protein kinase
MQQTLIDDRYALSNLLGSGGMAKVYLAHDDVLDRDVALKVLRDQYVKHEEFFERFRREARSAAALNHPNIVSAYDGLPIRIYNDLTVAEAKKKLGGLPQRELKRLRSYEKKYENRKTLVE